MPNPSKYRNFLAPHEYDAIVSIMPRPKNGSHAVEAREAARLVLVNGLLTTEAAKACEVSLMSASSAIRSVLRARHRLLRAMELLNNSSNYGSNSQGETKMNEKFSLVCASEVKPKPIQWLWRGWLAAEKLHVLTGAPKDRTAIAMSLAATVSSGGRWPDGSRAPAGNVIVWSDDDQASLAASVSLSGGSPQRVFFAGEQRPFDPGKDIDLLRQQAAEVGDVRLIVVDPMAILTARGNARAISQCIQPLTDLAASCGAAVLSTLHIDHIDHTYIRALAKIVLTAKRVKGKEQRVLLYRDKSNIGQDEGGFECTLMPGEYVAWGKPIENVRVALA